MGVQYAGANDADDSVENEYRRCTHWVTCSHGWYGGHHCTSSRYCDHYASRQCTHYVTCSHGWYGNHHCTSSRYCDHYGAWLQEDGSEAALLEDGSPVVVFDQSVDQDQVHQQPRSGATNDSEVPNDGAFAQSD